MGAGKTKVEAKANTGLIATDTSTQNETIQEAEVINIENINKEVPMWIIYSLGVGVFCFALIIPSPFRWRGF
jgi:hypothetical protein